MSVTVSLTFATAAEAAAFLGGGAPSPAQSGKGASGSAKNAEAASSATTSSAAKEKAYDETALPAKLNAAVKAGKKDKALEILAKYGAKKGPELKAKDFAAAEADIDALLAAEESIG